MVIIQDTREKHPFNFVFYGYETSVATLKTGDYTLEGYEDIVCIERKKTPSELANNLGRHQRRFDNEMERMSEFDCKYIVCEFPEEALLQFPKNSGMPKRVMKYVRMNGKYMRKCLYSYEEEYGIETIFCQDRAEAEDKIISIFLEVVSEDE